MKKIINKTEKARNGKTGKTGETRKNMKIDESDLDPVELSAMHCLAVHLAIRRMLKDLAEGKNDEKEASCGILADDEEDELKKAFYVSPEHRIHLDPDEETWEEDGDDENETESAINKFLSDNYKPNIFSLYMPCPRAQCTDDYTVSIQAGSSANDHCWPHEDMNEFPHVSNKIYDVLKWTAQFLLPALGTLYFVLAGIWNFPYGEQVVGTITAVDTFLGAILGISTAQYKKKNVPLEE